MKISPESLKTLRLYAGVTVVVGTLWYGVYEIKDYEYRAALAARRGEYLEPPVMVQWVDRAFVKVGLRPISPPRPMQPCGMCGMG